MGRLCSVEGCGRAHDARGFCSSHGNRFRRYGDPLAGKAYREGAAQAFLEDHLDYDGEDCLIWPFGVATNGYARINIKNTKQCASRRMCEMKHGAPPTPNHHAAHSCGRGMSACVHPKHVRWATKAENEQDKLAHGTHNRGERHGMVKLTQEQVLAIRARSLAGESYSQIARTVSVGPGAVGDIVRRKNWAWLT